MGIVVAYNSRTVRPSQFAGAQELAYGTPILHRVHDDARSMQPLKLPRANPDPLELRRRHGGQSLVTATVGDDQRVEPRAEAKSFLR